MNIALEIHESEKTGWSQRISPSRPVSANNLLNFPFPILAHGKTDEKRASWIQRLAQNKIKHDELESCRIAVFCQLPATTVRSYDRAQRRVQHKKVWRKGVRQRLILIHLTDLSLRAEWEVLYIREVRYFVRSLRWASRMKALLRSHLKFMILASFVVCRTYGHWRIFLLSWSHPLSLFFFSISC